MGSLYYSGSSLKKRRYKDTFSTLLMLFLLFFIIGFGVHINAQQTVQIGSGNGTNEYIPSNYLYEKSYNQTIYTYNELVNSGMDPGYGLINKIRYKATISVPTSDWEDWTIYMGNTLVDGFVDGDSWIAIGNLTQVFDGTISPAVVAGQWMEITLDIPFQWDGTSNLVVAVNQTTPLWGINDPAWASYTLPPVSGSKAIYEYDDGPDFDPANPPLGALLTNDVPQIQFDGDLMPPCAGVPNAGVLADSLGVCIGEPYTLITTGATAGVGGLVGQWQYRDAGSADPWTDLIGATDTIYVFPSATNDTIEYRYLLSCGADEGYSNTMTIYFKSSNECYCTPEGTNPGRYIDNFSTSGGVQDITNNGSGFSSNGYGDFTNMIVEQSLLGAVNFSVDVVGGTQGFKIWVDWDNSGTFSPNEIVYQSSGYASNHTGSFTVPLNATVGTTRMRIGGDWGTSSGPADPCITNFNNGEFEDYTFEITPLAPCAGTPTAGVIDGNSIFGACLGEGITLTVSGYSIEGDISYQWQQEVPAGSGTWTDIQGENGFTLNLPNGISDTTNFRFIATCDNTLDSDITNIVTVTLNNYMDCYCTPVYTVGCASFDDNIDNFTLTGENGTLQNLNSGCSPNGYGDFTNAPTIVIPDLYIDSTYSGTIGTNSVFDESARIWIDYNNNGTFESNEEIAVINNMGVTSSFSFTVASGYVGLHRMRVRMVDVLDASNLDPCVAYSFGETEDYIVNIMSDAVCASPFGITQTEIWEDSVQVSWIDISGAASWNIEYGPAGFTPGTGTMLNGVTSNPLMITGLNSSSDYDFYIQSDCGNSGSSWTGPIVLQTECGILPSSIFCEDFEDISKLRCWEIIDNNSDFESWNIYQGFDLNNVSIARSGIFAAGIYTDFHAGNNDDYLVLPKMTLTGNEAMQYFYRVMDSAEPNDYEVVLSTTGSEAADFVNVLLTHNNVSNMDYRDTVIDLSAYSGDVYIAFRVPPGGLDGWYLFIDDICIDICIPNPGTDGNTNVCRLDQTIDLNTIVTSDYNYGSWHFPANQSVINNSTFDYSSLASGTYEMLYVVETFCTADTTKATISVYNTSSAGAGGTIEVCKGGKINLFSALSGNVDLGGAWYDYEWNQLSGSLPTAPIIPANYNYKYITSNGVCPADTAIVEVIVLNEDCELSIDEEFLKDISIYPNPTTNQLHIENSSNISDLKIEIIDMNGRIVFIDNKSLNNSSKTTLNIEHIDSGVYTLRIYNNEGQQFFKIIKQ